ncbi:MAG: PucR family transcriptional regulator ligand-binding domain-containing protein [Eubacterium sp.]|nr:PucR family transcriptional regulator ligand-binding domain-containing protein [Eubacterium sp.]
MALTIKDIMDENMFPGATLLTGRENAGNLVNWITVQEILDAVDSLSEGDLLVTTGYDLAEASRHQNLVSRMKQNGVAGMMIQTGYYIDQIPVYLLEAGRKFHFPIIELPARYKFSEVSKKLIREINRESIFDEHSFLDYSFFGDYVRERYQKALRTADIHDKPACLITITPKASYECEIEVFEETIEQIKSLFANECFYYIGDWVHEFQAVFMLSFEDDMTLLRTTGNLHDMMVRMGDFKGIELLGSGEQLHSLEELNEAFAHCIETLHMLHAAEAKRGFCFYKHYPFVKRFFVLSRNDLGYSKDHPMLQTLIKKDRESNTAYVQTLRILLLESGNVSKAAKRLFIHRHTLLNRMEVIHDLTGFHYEDYYERLSFQIALQVHDYFGA